MTSNCFNCKKYSALLFECSCCKNKYCTKCRLPEKHFCKKIDLLKIKDTKISEIIIKKKVENI